MPPPLPRPVRGVLPSEAVYCGLQRAESGGTGCTHACRRVWVLLQPFGAVGDGHPVQAGCQDEVVDGQAAQRVGEEGDGDVPVAGDGQVRVVLCRAGRALCGRRRGRRRRSKRHAPPAPPPRPQSR